MIGVGEAHVVINGQRLTRAQSMTLRVAVSSFAWGLTPEHVKELGQIGEAYLQLANELLVLLIQESA